MQALKPRSFSDYTLMQKCLNELHLLGYMLSGNFLDILEMHPSAKNTVSAIDVPKYLGKRIKVFGSPVTERIHHVNATGEVMEFLTLEDKTEHMDIIFWPSVFKHFQDDLVALGPCEVYGKVTQDYGTYCIVADFIRPVEWSPNMVDFELASAKLQQSANQYRRYEDIKELQEMA